MQPHVTTVRRRAPCLPVLAVSLNLLLGACASAPPGGEARATFPLPRCDISDTPGCVAPFFSTSEAIGPREPGAFPARYLELYREEVRQEYCRQTTSSAPAAGSCELRLLRLSEYFNPQGLPAAGSIGVALEGGGSKAAPYALGTLAGLQQLGLLGTSTGAIASVSGGSYAASYYFNRLYDQATHAPDAGTPEDWFRACIPEAVLERAPFQALAQLPHAMNCRELHGTPQERRHNEFARAYEFVGHVWKHTDLLLGDGWVRLSQENSLHSAEAANVVGLGVATALTVPFHFLSRSVFRWPLNSSPSKLAYKLGIERAYGYTPHDWAAARPFGIDHWQRTLFERRKARTLSHFAKLGESAAPQWIIASTAPGDISGAQWLQARPRDPLRQQFEISWNGYGSGTYGYTRLAPEAQFDFLGRNADGLPVMDAVVASAAFFDDDQTQISQQPLRFILGTVQHFANLTWFTEMRNFNVAENSRAVAKVLPWPLYLGTLDQYSHTPYIHLQDGGNSENTGILPLLRRGYETIVYAHGTEDRKASWSAICHLKNQLELDGSYYVRSPTLEALTADRPTRRYGLRGLQFRSYLDEACSAELDASDLATYDKNVQRAHGPADAAVARLFCQRLGAEFNCPEFHQRFHSGNFKIETETAPASKDPSTLFQRWPSRQVLSFNVLRDGSENWIRQEPTLEQKLSTVVAVVPGVDSQEVAAQLRASAGSAVPDNWPAWCEARKQGWESWRVPTCLNPQQQLLGTGGADRALPCVVLAHLVADECKGNGSAAHPSFPQDDFVAQTLHASYLKYGAYYELARHQTRETLCKLWPALRPGQLARSPAACQLPAAGD
jgi:hypothetical protein